MTPTEVMEPVELRMRPSTLKAMRALSRRLSFEHDREVSWADVMRAWADYALTVGDLPTPRLTSTPN